MENKRKMMIFFLLLAVISSPVFAGEWTASVVKNLDALVTSCVVIPCSYTHAKERLPHSRLRGIWYLVSGQQVIYHEDKTLIAESFRGRTTLLGNLGQDNCTLEMTEIKDHDNGPFCFRIELVPTGTETSKIDKFSFVHDCVSFNMITKPPKPILLEPKTPIQGHPYTITCSVFSTCPTRLPKLTWSRGTADEIHEAYREIHKGFWEVLSTVVFIPQEKDDHTDISCTAQFYGGMMSTEKLTIYVKRTVNYNHIIIPVVVGISIAGIFGGLCIFMMKKYKNRIAELQSQDGTMWNRLSRMSRRIRSVGPGSSHTDRSRPKVNRSDADHMSNNACSKSTSDHNFSKPRFPSPKSQPKYSHKEELDNDNDYLNTADLVYGNL